MAHKSTKRALLMSVLSVVLCVTMLMGTTFAWFTDSVTSGRNVIMAGNLDIELEYYDADDDKFKAVNENVKLFNDKALWEPGYTEVAYLKVSNKGSLALKYQLSVNVVGEETIGKTKDGADIKLSEHLVFSVVERQITAEADLYTREQAIAAAGSEGSGDSVITNDRTMQKWGASGEALRPRFSVLNPAFTCTLPPYQTACGITDIMVHVLERYFTPTRDVETTDRLCEALMKTIVEAAPKALANPNDYAARADLMWAGMLAHNNSCGVGRKQDWASHQIEHELSAFYDCAHGAGLAVVLPAWMSYVMPTNPARFARFAVEVFGCELDPMDIERTAKEGIRRLKSFFRLLGMPTTLGEIGAKVEDVPEMVLHRAEKPNGFPFGGVAEIGPGEMADILFLCGEE